MCMDGLPCARDYAKSHQQPYEAVTVFDPILYSLPLSNTGLNYTSLLTYTWIFLDTVRYCNVFVLPRNFLSFFF